MPAARRIGIDFDNTIVCYDGVFRAVAIAEGLVPADVPAHKTGLRDWLRAAGREDDWTELQGLVYGRRMDAARPFAGVMDFFQTCAERAIPVAIVSHRTRQPYRGPAWDLHAAARQWLADQRVPLADEAIFFETTKEDKLARIGALGLSHFIDDLPELLAEPAFPAEVEPILFDPHRLHAGHAGRRLASWADAASLLPP